ncbi:hypothetical protein ALI22I_29620 [Saccharothrix sp. ALI-22-I]|uniref:hypothetical protein n=1 Tax=Saccharothrix sp. ALI-22-I TaxID=1933778 RepID=UPI00097C802E|nr:hypothetical protein [Saccharothrix sp. ALI-22-I]ONI84685.1 hypothetical protein ALI22I_29620 [Saccharothrix sp. ALI-22-I]
MVPYTTILVPLYILLGWIGLQNSLVGLGLVLAMFQLPFGLFMMRSSFEALQAGVVTSALPCVVVFLLLQRHYVRGFTSGALKG